MGFWVVIAMSYDEDDSSMVLQNIGIQPRHYGVQHLLLYL